MGAHRPGHGGARVALPGADGLREPALIPAPSIDLSPPSLYSPPRRAVAQFGSALQWGCRGRRFESSRPDQIHPGGGFASEPSSRMNLHISGTSAYADVPDSSRCAECLRGCVGFISLCRGLAGECRIHPAVPSAYAGVLDSSRCVEGLRGSAGFIPLWRVLARVCWIHLAVSRACGDVPDSSRCGECLRGCAGFISLCRGLAGKCRIHPVVASACGDVGTAFWATG